MSYCIARAAEVTGVELHAVCFMSNHWHAVVSDPLARLPEFLEHAHRAIAKCMNVALRRWENFWSSDKPNIVELVSESDVLAKMAYVLANPTAAGLVELPAQWPGLITRKVGERVVCGVPEVYFDRERAPKTAELEFTRPQIMLQLSDQKFSEALNDAVAVLVARARERLRREGRKFVGVRAVMQQSPQAQPNAAEPHHKLSPRIAARIACVRSSAVRALKDFVAAYKQAFENWRRGQPDVVFPAGTYALRLRAPIKCESWGVAVSAA